jgi:type III restriction enzyme
MRRAPFTLVSMRGAKDTDFGIQVVGRILRVHSRLQGPTLEKKLPELLRHGYVFLADAANQSGLVHAGEKINAIQSELSQVCPFTMVVKVAGTNEIQVSHNGQSQLLAVPYTPPCGPRQQQTRTLPLTVCRLRASRLPGNRQEF